jgi:hypothetical protein
MPKFKLFLGLATLMIAAPSFAWKESTPIQRDYNFVFKFQGETFEIHNPAGT